MLSCLADSLPNRLGILELEESPIREYQTERENQIDILLKGTGWVVAIENKIRAGLYNEFAEYRATIDKRYPDSQRNFVILAPDDPHQIGWLWISYRCLLAKARAKLGEWIVSSGISKWSIFLREFLIHLENQLGRPMDSQQFKFVLDHYSEVNEVITLRKAYIDRLTELITEAGTDTLGASPARVIQQNWYADGIALRLYPSADREHNSTFFGHPEGWLSNSVLRTVGSETTERSRSRRF